MLLKHDSQKLLLTTVFKPYGVKDEYAEALGMQMELFNNQITREQGIHSLRSSHWTFPLYFLAENVSVPTIVLDFPSWRGFVRELKKGYTHVGISFIQTNVMKARRMAEYIRKCHPEVQIILGGYGTLVPDIAEIVPHDALCPGEGIQWLREYFGEESSRPIRHPVLHGMVGRRVYGLPLRSVESAVLFPGLGCTNACSFCSTSAKFNHKYIPILPDGKSVFQACRAAEDQLGVMQFAVIDENFLKNSERARELLAEMEANGKAYNFALFSSAETLSALGVDFLVRLGAGAVWIGIESERPIFEKMANVDVRALIHDLQSHGISVISSSILFLDHHDKDGIEKAIDWAIDMKGDQHQFMQLTPLAGTPLFEEYSRKGLLLSGFPYTRASGQDVLNFAHPHFSSEEATEITRRAFLRSFEKRGPGLLNMARTFVRGYRKAREDAANREQAGLSWDPDALGYVRNGKSGKDPFMAFRLEMMKRNALRARPIVPVARLYAPNSMVRREAARITTLFREEFGKSDSGILLKQAALTVSGAVEHLQRGLHRFMKGRELIRNPPMRRIEYRMNQV